MTPTDGNLLLVSGMLPAIASFFLPTANNIDNYIEEQQLIDHYTYFNLSIIETGIFSCLS